jgi:hypothetical protein
VGEAVGAVVLVQARVALGAVEPEPRAAGGGDELAGVVEELGAGALSGVVAVDGEAAEVAGVVGWVGPEFAVGGVYEGEGGERLAVVGGEVELAASDQRRDRFGREGADLLVGDALGDEPVVGLAQEGRRLC